MKLIKKITLILLFIFGITYHPSTPNAISKLIPVAGTVTYYNPISCTTPKGVNFTTIQKTPPYTGSGTWMFLLPGSFSKLNLAPTRPGQEVLGLSYPIYAPCLTPCPTGLCPTGPGGLTIWYIGGGI